ncbi:MAG: [Fe-Fe] hydrogenase large subunit C-terminal domain-containing protein [Bacteroidales bacterium]|nr:[Fe-Fe] hydrogenase large subunit C-terminal domain-containing protein [Bacteroidales bacterium]
MNSELTYFYHALKIDKDICIGCTHCMKSCPTEAIRIRDGKAVIYENKCIDCGECFRVCPVNAIYIKQDDFSELSNFKYRIALVPAVFIGQFADGVRTSQIYSCLKKLGFTHIYEVEHGVGGLINLVQGYMNENPEKKPFISSFCPAVVRLIQVRFPSLVKNLVHLKAPVDLASVTISERLTDAGINRKDIGIFYITPCAAKIAAVKSPAENQSSSISGVINMDFLFNKVSVMLTKDNSPAEPINHSLSGRDILWTLSGGEASNFEGRCFAVDGLRNVIDFLEKIENGEIESNGIIEMRVCDQSCAGGVLNPNNRFVAVEKIKNRAVYLDSKLDGRSCPLPSFSESFNTRIKSLMKIEEIKPRSILKLDDNLQVALKMVETINKTKSLLPGVDCAACGAPSCSALAEDVARKEAAVTDCIFVSSRTNHCEETLEKIWNINNVKSK